MCLCGCHRDPRNPDPTFRIWRVSGCEVIRSELAQEPGPRLLSRVFRRGAREASLRSDGGRVERRGAGQGRDRAVREAARSPVLRGRQPAEAQGVLRSRGRGRGSRVPGLPVPRRGRRRTDRRCGPRPRGEEQPPPPGAARRGETKALDWAHPLPISQYMLARETTESTQPSLFQVTADSSAILSLSLSSSSTRTRSGRTRRCPLRSRCTG